MSKPLSDGPQVTFSAEEVVEQAVEQVNVAAVRNGTFSNVVHLVIGGVGLTVSMVGLAIDGVVSSVEIQTLHYVAAAAGIAAAAANMLSRRSNADTLKKDSEPATSSPSSPMSEIFDPSERAQPVELAQAGKQAPKEGSGNEEHGELAKMRYEGFDKRNGEKLKLAMGVDDPKAFQELVDSLGLEKALTMPDKLRIRCMDGRIRICGCGGPGCCILSADKKGNAMVPTATEAARNILKAPAISRSKLPIEIEPHDGCGAGRLALAAVTGKKPEELTDAEVNEFSTNRAHELVRALQAELARTGDIKRIVTFRQAKFDDKDMQNFPAAHPERVITITDFGDDTALDPASALYPESMQLHPDLLSEQELALSVETAIKILLGKHGPGETPILIIGLTNKPEGAAATQAKIEKALAKVPGDQRKLIRTKSAVVKSPEKK